jgi:hypothetical protein
MRRAIKAQLKVNRDGSGETYRREAAELGLAWVTCERDVSVLDSLPKLAMVQRLGKEAGAILQATWRMLSGYEHGLTFAALRGSDMSVVAPVPGGQTVQLSVNDEALVMALKSTYLLLLEAGRLYDRRCTQAH